MLHRRMNRLCHNLPVLACTLVVLATCASPARKSSVWDTYDVRHPVPQSSTVPDAYARQYDGYIDNDSYYVAPACSVFDAPSCGGD